MINRLYEIRIRFKDGDDLFLKCMVSNDVEALRRFAEFISGRDIETIHISRMNSLLQNVMRRY